MCGCESWPNWNYCVQQSMICRSRYFFLATGIAAFNSLITEAQLPFKYRCTNLQLLHLCRHGILTSFGLVMGSTPRNIYNLHNIWEFHHVGSDNLQVGWLIRILNSIVRSLIGWCELICCPQFQLFKDWNQDWQTPFWLNHFIFINLEFREMIKMPPRISGCNMM